MDRCIRWTWKNVLLLTCLTLLGCLERDERIRVAPDGGVAITATTTADAPAEFTAGRVPTAAAGWSVQPRQIADGARKVRHQQVATQRFAPGAALPDRDGDPADPQAQAFVAFPTTLTVEQRPEGKVYHFRRVYRARPRAQVNAIEKRAGHEQVEQWLKQDPAAITPEQWTQVVRFGAQTEALKRIALAREAALALPEALTQDRWLVARAAMLGVADALDAGALVQWLQSPQSPQREEALAAAARAFESDLDRGLMQAVASWPQGQRQRFTQELSRLKARDQVTAEQSGQRYRVAVELPGNLLGSNADRVENGQIIWEFDGQAFCDRDLELLASSLAPEPR
jgi:hypothetical protein